MCGDQMQSHAIVLTEEEEDALSSVFEEELQLQRDEENRLKRLRNEVDRLEQKSNSYTASCCSCCGVRFGLIINRGASCPICTKRACKQHRCYDLHSNSWRCTLCDMRVMLCINEETLSSTSIEDLNKPVTMLSGDQGTNEDSSLKRYSLPESAMLNFMTTNIQPNMMNTQHSSLLKSSSCQDITIGTNKDKVKASSDHTRPSDTLQQTNISSQPKPILLHPNSGDNGIAKSVDQPRSSATLPRQSKKKHLLEMNDDELRSLTMMNTKINRGSASDLRLGMKAGTDKPVHLGDMRVMIQFVPDTSKSGKEKGRGSLNIWIQQARGLRTCCDQGTYLQCTLLPRGKQEKFKSVVVQGGSNPTYNTMYQFDKVTNVELSYDRVLEITIWEPHRNTNEFVGGLRLGPKPQPGNKNKWMDSAGSEVSQWEMMMADPNQWIDAWHPLRCLIRR
ncbi:uncharacterized protein [Dysidea avara]|uniref:uncharacterized protein n=1 Tax=Dysidea avara TaxID=196820 RepID=UPI003328AB6D